MKPSPEFWEFFAQEDGKRIEHLPEERHDSDVLKPKTETDTKEKNKDNNG